ncbi:metallophosphoesterase [Candidatus Viridilinea mediisalina]|uniref:Calcineurin-like phosphoesterase domain-containing protein n=1 Tax=Candidatus Viridilinea mediisalina TaxID=2024553 RepID=A0A2A6RFR6_9CHLR|nr:metallophosphoesterase [Candidatus Viridilinea mediisalina]PDW01862.1 hypothetical protein CJ255_16995 [Candidatus Viridilinea mediisalina]
MDKVTYVVSDLHLGPGWMPNGQMDPLEDFVSGEQFARFLEKIGRSREPVELVIAGDFLEYCQTLPEIGLKSPQDDLGSTEEESLRRTRVILGLDPHLSSGHALVFQALRRFMMENHSITIIAGNHDIDLLWKRVWALIFDTIYPPGSWGDLRRVNYSYTLGSGPQGRVFIEHGHEHDRANRFGDLMTQPFGIDYAGVRRLKRCWGTLFVDKVYNDLERERWFIDNVKPILRIVRLGLRHDFIFTATAIGLVMRFLINSGLPPILGRSLAADEDYAPPDLDELAKLIDDPDLARAVCAQLAEPEGRKAIAAALEGLDLPPALILAGARESLRLDEPEPDLEAPIVLGARRMSMGGDDTLLGGARREDEYRSAARATLESDPSITTVIMGHTHTPINGFSDPLRLPDRREGYFFNTGTWTQHLRDETKRTYTWPELADPQNYTTSCTYVRLDPDGKGGYRPVLRSWAEEE